MRVIRILRQNTYSKRVSFLVRVHDPNDKQDRWSQAGVLVMDKEAAALFHDIVGQHSNMMQWDNKDQG